MLMTFRVSGYSESRFANAVAILASLTTYLKQGKYTGNIRQPSKIVHVCYSYESVLTHTLVTKYSTLSDGVILTGIGYNTTTTSFPAFFEGPHLSIADTVSPGRYPGRDSGYLAYADAIGNLATFFHQGSFDEEILWYTQDVAQLVAVIEFVTGSPLSIISNPGVLAFAGSVNFSYKIVKYRANMASGDDHNQEV